uniref:Uncharacterized protein n=1 Tax=Timema cristinae TaxID=61476 RepID=A0A7R9CQ90_TIMCR|nr:unnamed protein product [Timema cristinae]
MDFVQLTHFLDDPPIPKLQALIAMSGLVTDSNTRCNSFRLCCRLVITHLGGLCVVYPVAETSCSRVSSTRNSFPHSFINDAGARLHPIGSKLEDGR